MRFFLAVLLSLLALAAAACGDDDDGDGDGDAAVTPTAPATDPAVKAADRAGVDVTGQETLLLTSDSFRSALERENVTMKVLAPARRSGDAIELPIDGGRVSVEDGGGTIEHSGAIVLAGGPKDGRIEARDLFVDTRSGTVYALIGGSRVRFITLDTSRLEVQRGEDHVVAGDLQARLAGDGAAVVKDELGASIEAGQEIGAMRVRLVPRLPAGAGAPDADAAEREALAELRELERRARELADEAGSKLSPEDRERLDEAGRALEKALQGS